jgi:hypothetical protein
MDATECGSEVMGCENRTSMKSKRLSLSEEWVLKYTVGPGPDRTSKYSVPAAGSFCEVKLLKF